MSGWLSSARWLAVARILALIYVVLVVASLVWSMPAVYATRRALAPGTLPASAFYGWTTAQLDSVAASLGLQSAWVASLLFGASLACLTCFLAVGGLLFWRRSDTGMGLLVAFTLITTGPGFAGLPLTQTQLLDWQKGLFALAAIIIWPTFAVLLYLFPTGRFVPRLTRYFVLLPYLLFVASSFLTEHSPLAQLLLWAFLFYILAGLLSQIYRYWRVSSLAERQQTKWVVSAFGVFVVSLLLTQLVPTLFPAWAVGTPARFLYEFIPNGILGYLLPALFPLAIGVAILRYRLWDIDVIIRRTLVYAVLTCLLALAYFGSIIVLQDIFGVLTGQQETPLVTVISTLAIAALFVPLRQRVQRVIDRRLYRRKYDAAHTLAAFAAALRDETDLARLTDRMVEVVDLTMQPAHMGLWLNAAPAQPASPPGMGHE